MGTEIGPDNAYQEGTFSAGDLAMARLTGKPPPIEDLDGGGDLNETKEPIQFGLPVTPQEKERLKASKLVVELRFHYRHVAAGLAWKAAGLLPDRANETADVLNAAGQWLVARHEKQAARFLIALKKRCSHTEIGKHAVAGDRFVDTVGAWSAEESKRMPSE